MKKRKYQTGGRVRSDESEGYIELEGGPMTDEEHMDINRDVVRRTGNAARTNNTREAVDAVDEMLRVGRKRDMERARQPNSRERARNVGTHRYGNGGAVRGTKWGKIC